MKKHSVRGKVIKTVLYLAGGFISLLLLLTIVFYSYRDQIGKKVLLRVNNIQQGEVSFSGISFSPFIHFPDMSVKLKDVLYVYSNPADSLPRIDTLARLGSLYMAADVVGLLSGRIVISSITLGDGTISLVQYPDSSINLLHAIGTYGRPAASSSLPEQDSPEVQDPFELSIQKINLRDVGVLLSRTGEPDTARVGINYAESSLEYQDGKVSGALDLDASLRDLRLLKGMDRGGLPVLASTTYSYDRETGMLTIEPASLKVRSAVFSLDGSLSIANQLVFDLSLTARDIDVSFFKLWLSKKGMKNLRSGETFFTGTICGSFNDSIPQMDFTFGVRNVELNLPGARKSITGLGFEGAFHSGTRKDLSQAALVIDKLSGKLPGGHIKGALDITDFTRPSVSLVLDIEADILGFDEVFNIKGVSGATGKFRFNDKAEGIFDTSAKTWMEKENESVLELDSVSMDIAGFGPLNDVCGVLNRLHDTLSVRELRFNAGNSDFSVDGEIRNLLSLFTRKDEPLTASLRIVSDTFDLPAFLSFEPRVGENFPYRITGIDLDLDASTTRDELLHFESNPGIRFVINHLEATIENLFPQVVINRGSMLMSEKEGRVFLMFNDFQLDVANGSIETDLSFHSPPGKPDHLGVDADIRGLDPALLFFKGADTIPPIARGGLDAIASAQLDLGNDSISFVHIILDLKNMDYVTLKDTISANGFVLEAMDVQYDAGDNPLASLSGTLDLKAAAVRTNHFAVEDVAYSIDAEKGRFVVYPENMQFFGKEGEGVYELSPFSANPEYKLKYRVNDFLVETLLQKIVKDTVLTGPMDMELDLEIAAVDKSRLLSGLNGSITMHGHDLTMYGIDLDNLIAKYEKSQKFNLVDLGAVALAGPFGLAITKGSQFATLAIGNFGESTAVVEMISDWTCVEGRLTIDDVAFTTANNLVAGRGWIDLAGDSLNISIAVLNKYNCSVVSQTVYGALKNPQYSEVNLVGTVLGPITNLVDGSQGKDCETFYSGRLKHPLAENKNNKQ